MEEREKLKVLLTHWMAHNHEHKEEFQEWAEKAKDFGAMTVHNEITEAVKFLEKANTSLSKASDILAAEDS